MRVSRALFATLLFGASTFAAETTARAADKAASPSEKAACLQASELGQSLRKEGKLQDARDQLTACADDRCPAVVKGDCTTWAAEVTAAIPSLIFVARDGSGQALTDVTVAVDGKAVPAVGASAAPFNVDPGKHVVQFNRDGAAPIRVDVTLAANDKKHEVDATFVSAASRDGARRSRIVPSSVPRRTDRVRLGRRRWPRRRRGPRRQREPQGEQLAIELRAELQQQRRRRRTQSRLSRRARSSGSAAHRWLRRRTCSSRATVETATAPNTTQRAAGARSFRPSFDVVPSTSGARAIVHGEF